MWAYDISAGLKALEMLGKHRGMYTERISISEAEALIDGMSDDELRVWIKRKETELGARGPGDDEDGGGTPSGNGGPSLH